VYRGYFSVIWDYLGYIGVISFLLSFYRVIYGQKGYRVIWGYFGGFSNIGLNRGF